MPGRAAGPTVARLLLTGSTVATIALTAAVAGVAGTIGPDARWLAVLGRSILALGGLPHGVPFAAAPSDGWHNVPVLAELIFRGLQSSLGDRGLLVAQVAAAVLAVVVVSREARRLGATDAGTAAAVVAVLCGGLLAFAGIRAQLFSLALFPVLVALLRSEQARPSRRIWLSVPLVALWSNLHGTVLVGVAVALIYLCLERGLRRPLESAGLGAALLLALCATPALWETPRYYLDAVTNEAARRGYGLWTPLTLHSAFDVLLAGAALLLAAGFLRARPRPWQLAAAALLGAFTVHASRNGIWLLLFLAPPAATALRVTFRPPAAVSHGLALALVAAAVAGLVRGPLEIGAGKQLLAQAVTIAHGRPILAEPAVAEQIAQAGGRVWIGDPLDAFRHADQRLYLDWLQGKPAGDAIAAHASVILVRPASPAARRLALTQQADLRARDGKALLFVRK